MVKVLVTAPSAAALPKLKVPWAKVTVLVAPSVFTPESTKVPAPVFVRLNAPLITPLSVNGLATPSPGEEVLIVLSAGNARVPARFKGALPRKLIVEADQVIAAVDVVVTEAPEVLSMLPPAIVKALAAVPIAPAVLIFSVPALSTTPPVNVFAPPSVRVPAPSFVKAKAPLITPGTMRLLPLTVTVRAAESATVPDPRLRTFDPVNVKLPLQVCAPVVAMACGKPLVLSMVPPVILTVPAPKAEAPETPPLLILSVPVELVTRPPEKVLYPPSVTVPAPLSVRA